MTTTQQSFRYSDPNVKEDIRREQPCKHDNNTTFSCDKLMTIYINPFRLKLFETTDSQVQDNYLLIHITTQPVKRRRTENPRKQHTHSNIFKMRCADRQLLRACSEKNRADGVFRRHQATSVNAKEGRSCDQRSKRSKRSETKKVKMRHFNGSLRGSESHYSRNKIVRIYLPSEFRNVWNIYVNIKKKKKKIYI